MEKLTNRQIIEQAIKEKRGVKWKSNGGYCWGEGEPPFFPESICGNIIRGKFDREEDAYGIDEGEGEWYFADEVESPKLDLGLKEEMVKGKEAKFKWFGVEPDNSQKAVITDEELMAELKSRGYRLFMITENPTLGEEKEYILARNFSMAMSKSGWLSDLQVGSINAIEITF